MHQKKKQQQRLWSAIRPIYKHTKMLHSSKLEKKTLLHQWWRLWKIQKKYRECVYNSSNTHEVLFRLLQHTMLGTMFFVLKIHVWNKIFVCINSRLPKHTTKKKYFIINFPRFFQYQTWNIYIVLYFLCFWKICIIPIDIIETLKWHHQSTL